MFILICYGVSAAVTICLLDKAIYFLDFKKITITKTFYCFFFLMTWLPGPFIYFENGRNERNIFLLGIMLGLLSATLGTVVSAKIQNFKTLEAKKYYEKKPENLTNTQLGHINKLHLSMLLSAAAILILYCFTAPIIPIAHTFQNLSPEELQLQREAAFKLLDPRWNSVNSTKFFYLFLILRTTIFPFLILTSFALFLTNKNSKTFMLFISFLILGLFYAASSLARAPVAAILLRIIILWLILFNVKFTFFKFSAALFAVLIFPAFITSFYKSRTLVELCFAIIERLTVTPARDLYYFFEIFPKHKDFLNGHTLARPFYDLVGIKSFYLENYVSMYISPTCIKTAHTNAMYISNLYADFGLFGIILGSFFIGILLQFIDTKILRSRKCFLNCSLFAFFVYLAVVLNFGSITSVLLANGGVVVLALWMTFKLALQWSRH